MNSEQHEKSTEELIDALNALHDSMHKNQCYACSNEFIEVANEFGTNILAEAIERLKQCVDVVRCKDCKWWDKKEGSNYGYCHACKHGHISDHWEIGIYRTYKGDWFCAEGERKEGG